MASDFNITTTGELPAGMDPALGKQLESALGQLRSDPSAAARFVNDPEAYLKSAGVDTDGLKFESGKSELSDADLEQVAGGSICASGGYYVCVTGGN
jgi:hypothetical protein